MNPVMTLMLLVLVAVSCLPEAKETYRMARDPKSTRIRSNKKYVNLPMSMQHLGRCIRRYGHSCLGGHGKRSQLPILSNTDLLFRANLQDYESSSDDEEQVAPPRPLMTSDREDDGEKLFLLSASSHEDTLNEFWRQLLKFRKHYYDQESLTAVSADEEADI